MSRTMKCLKCSSIFAAPTTASKGPIACPRCGAARAVTDNARPASVKPALTDEDVLEFLGPPPRKKA